MHVKMNDPQHVSSNPNNLFEAANFMNVCIEETLRSSIPGHDQSLG